MAEAPPIQDNSTPRRRYIWWVMAGVVALVSLSAFVLYRFNPEQTGYYPRCMFHVWTGLDCPGCGGLRAAHQLLHGNFGAAFSFNPLLVTLAPAAALLAVWTALARWRRQRQPRVLQNPKVAWALAVAVIAFGVLRNIPWRG